MGAPGSHLGTRPIQHLSGGGSAVMRGGLAGEYIRADASPRTPLKRYINRGDMP